MGKLLHPDAEPTVLYEQFRQLNEEREAQQENTDLAGQHLLTEQAETVADYRVAREAELSLLAEPHLAMDDMTYSDYRKAREAEQCGKRIQGYSEHAREIKERK